MKQTQSTIFHGSSALQHRLDIQEGRSHIHNSLVNPDHVMVKFVLDDVNSVTPSTPHDKASTTTVVDQQDDHFVSSLPNNYICFDKPVTGLDLIHHDTIQNYVKQQKKKTDEKNELLAIKINQLATNVNQKTSFSQITVSPIMFYSATGNEIYRRSLVFVLGMAFQELYPDLHLSVEHALHRGYMSEVEGFEQIEEEMAQNIENKMKEIIEKDLPITEENVPFDMALEYFTKECNRPFSSLLIMSKFAQAITVDKCGDYYDLHYRPLVYRTGLLKHFSLVPYRQGMMLKFPPDEYKLEYSGESELSKNYACEAEKKSIIGELDESDALVRIYQESNSWGRITGIRCAGELNAHIRDKNIKHFIALNHALHDSKISKIARVIYKQRQNIRLVLAAGPSSSGKTTFAKKLSIQMEMLGLKPVILSVDDYYKERSQCPRDKFGNYDFEVIDALRIDVLNDHLHALLSGEEVEPPVFDFKIGAPRPSGRKVRMGPDSVLVMEGIHCLNDALTPKVDSKNKFRIFVAPMTQLNLDEMNFVSPTTNRLLRRIVRDYHHRAHSAEQTLERWPSVRIGEHKYIFPYITSANVIVNTALDYELAVLKPYAKPLLKMIAPSSNHFNRAKELLDFLNNFHSLSDEYIPSDSLLREFIGKSFFEED